MNCGWSRQSAKCSPHKLHQYDKWVPLKTRHEETTLVCTHYPCGKGKGLRGIVSALYTRSKTIRHNARWIPSLYLYLLKLTINITSCFACFNNKNEKCSVCTTQVEIPGVPWFFSQVFSTFFNPHTQPCCPWGMLTMKSSLFFFDLAFLREYVHIDFHVALLSFKCFYNW